MNDVLLRLLRAARGAGVRISVAEAIDGFNVADAVGFADRTLLKDSLSLTLAKTVEEKDIFERTFDRYFSRDAISTPLVPASAEGLDPDGEPGFGGTGGTGPAGDGRGEGMGGGGGGGGLGQLARMLLANDQAALTAEMERAGEAVGVSNITLFTQTNLYARRILEQMGMRQLEREIDATRKAENFGLADRLEQGRRDLIGQARAFVERQLELFAAGATRELRESILRRARLSDLDRRDFARMRLLVRDLAKKLAALYGRNRKRDRKGVLDIRRTMRRNMAFDGIPFRTVWKREKIDKPRVMAICDVSGSVRQYARFLLLFLYSLDELLSDVQSYAFTNHLVDVSATFESLPVEQAVDKVMQAVGGSGTDYGQMLLDLDEQLMHRIDHRTTVLILGDARNNRGDPRTEIMRTLYGRARRVIWLNPEPRSFWGLGDSEMKHYAPYCHIARECNSLRHLERTLDELLRSHNATA
jgi:uncharacterized protein with von Willebrand factor type A (vWA) domain